MPITDHELYLLSSSGTEGPPLPRAAAAIAETAHGLVGADPAIVASWFGRAMDLAIPANDGTIEGQRRTADAVRRRAKAANTIRAYRAGVRAWCAYAARHGIKALPADPNDVKAFLVDQREPEPPGQPLAMSTLRLRSAAIGYMHRLACLPSPTRSIEVIETLTGYRRATAELPQPKRALRLDVLARVVSAIGRDDLADLRDRAILLLGFAGALRRSEQTDQSACRSLVQADPEYGCVVIRIRTYFPPRDRPRLPCRF